MLFKVATHLATGRSVYVQKVYFKKTTIFLVGKNVKIVVGCVSLTLPKINSLKRTIQRERTEGNSVPVHPESLQELEIPLNYPRTSKNESFLLYDSGPEERRDIILEHEKC